MDNDNDILAHSRGDQKTESARRNVCQDIDVFLVQCVKHRGFKTRRQLFDWLLDLSKGFYLVKSFDVAAWMSMASLRVHVINFELARGGDHE